MQYQPRWSILLLLVSLLIITATAPAAAQKRAALPAKAPTEHRAVSKSDPKIKQLQQLLANTGFYPGSMTGIVTTDTKDAIIRAQKSFKLRPTGAYDQKLADILTAEARKKPTMYRKKLFMQASAYTTQDPGSGSLTKREHLLRKGLVAVDPKVIPLGTRLYIEGYGYAVADDIGSAIKGSKIDLAYESRKEALKFGRKTLTVYIFD